jgi:hypothetical protein
MPEPQSRPTWPVEQPPEEPATASDRPPDVTAPPPTQCETEDRDSHGPAVSRAGSGPVPWRLGPATGTATRMGLGASGRRAADTRGDAMVDPDALPDPNPRSPRPRTHVEPWRLPRLAPRPLLAGQGPISVDRKIRTRSPRARTLPTHVAASGRSGTAVHRSVLPGMGARYRDHRRCGRRRGHTAHRAGYVRATDPGGRVVLIAPARSPSPFAAVRHCLRSTRDVRGEPFATFMTCRSAVG